MSEEQDQGVEIVDYASFNTGAQNRGDLQGGHDLDASPPEPLDGPRSEQSTIAQPTGQIQREEAPEAQPDPSGAPPQPQEGQARRTGIQERINKLVRQRNEKSEENSRLLQEIAALRDSIGGLKDRVALPNSSAAPPANVGFNADPWAGGRAEPQGAQTPGDIAGIVEAAIAKAVAPLYQKAAVDQASTERRGQHEVAFQEAARDYPELLTPTSELRQVFNALYDNRPDVAQLPDAPLIIANMARGILADQRRGEQRVAADKRAAAVHVPTPAATDRPVGGGPSKTLVDAVEAAKQRIRQGGKSFQDYKLLRMASAFQARRK
jgi:hypothetical protein